MRLATILLSASLAVTARAGTIHGDPARFKAYEMKTPASGPCDTGSGPDEKLYIQEFLANKIVRLDQDRGGAQTEFAIPFSPPLPGFANVTIPVPGHGKFVLLSCAIRTGFDRFMYFSNGDHNQLVRFNASSGEVRVFTPPGLAQPLGNLEPLNDLTTVPDAVWFSQTTANVLTRFDYRTHQFTNVPVPTPLAVPVGMYYAQDGGVWFLEFAGNKVGRLDPNTHAIQEFPIAKECGPVVMRAETTNSNGEGMLWFACIFSSSLGGINTVTKEIIQIPTATPLSFPVEVAQDYQDNVWVSYLLQDKLGVYNPRTGNYTDIIYPDAIVSKTPVANLPPFIGSGIFGKPVGQPFSGKGVGNAIWFSQTAANKVVRYDLDGFVVP